MKKQLMSAEDVRKMLSKLDLAQLDKLSEKSGVPTSTIYKIKRGETSNPGIETVRKFMARLPEITLTNPPTPEAKAA